VSVHPKQASCHTYRNADDALLFVGDLCPQILLKLHLVELDLLLQTLQQPPLKFTVIHVKFGLQVAQLRLELVDFFLEFRFLSTAFVVVYWLHSLDFLMVLPFSGRLQGSLPLVNAHFQAVAQTIDRQVRGHLRCICVQRLSFEPVRTLMVRIGRVTVIRGCNSHLLLLLPVPLLRVASFILSVVIAFKLELLADYRFCVLSFREF